MNNLLKQLKPYWFWILIIIVFHMGRAYTTLLLPDYTSRLIDVGIQNAGFEYAVPLELQAETYQGLQTQMLDEEHQAFLQAYQTTDQGTYQLKDQIKADSQAMAELEQATLYPLALYQFAQGKAMPGQAQTDNKQADALPKEAMSKLTPAQMRPLIKKQMPQLNDQMLRTVGVNLVKDEYMATGNDVQAYQWQYLFAIGGQMLMIALFAVLVAVGAHFLSARISADIGYHLRRKIYTKTLNFSQYEINRFSVASLITRSTNDIQQIQMLMTIILRFTLFAPVMAVGGLYHIIRTGSQLSWIILVAILAVLITIGGLLYFTMPKFKILQKQVDQLNLIAREVLTGIQVIRSFGRQQFESARFQDANQDLMDTQLFVNRAMSGMFPLLMLIMNVITVLIVWTAGHQIAAGTLQVGEMTAFMAYAMQIIFSFMIFSMMAVMLPRAMVSADRVEEVLQVPFEITDSTNPTVIEVPRGIVEFKNVTFKYEGAKQDALTQINFQALPGQTTAVIGSTGSGKSTLMNLLLRFYDVTDGAITIDGHDVRQLTQKQIRDLIGYIPQKGVLFSGTMASNIKYSDATISDERMELAAETAFASEFIQAKTDGYQADISQGGSNVSGGQKQRLSIARAIAKDPLIYLFDDSFSALDYQTDAKLRKALSAITEKATVMIIAQRVSTILDADKIIVLESGEIVGMGTHQELMQTCDVYQEIAQSQLSAKEIENSMQVHEKGGDQ